MTGFEQARAMLVAGGRPPIGKTLDFTLVEAGEGRAAFEGTPEAQTYNPMGTVHGGYAATLLDSECGIATVTTLEPKVSYHKAMTADTGPVRAEGNVLAIGRRVAVVEAKVTNAKGRLLASATSTLLVISA